jgi:hypothetical protein
MSIKNPLGRKNYDKRKVATYKDRVWWGTTMKRPSSVTLTGLHHVGQRFSTKAAVITNAKDLTISRPDIRVKHCAYGNSVATFLNPLDVTFSLQDMQLW